MRDFPVKLCDRLLIPGSIKVSKPLVVLLVQPPCQ
jgi:hypothetical protein